MMRKFLFLFLLFSLSSCLQPPRAPSLETSATRSPTARVSPELVTESEGESVATRSLTPGVAGNPSQAEGEARLSRKSRESQVPSPKDFSKKPAKKFREFKHLPGYAEVSMKYPLPASPSGLSDGKRLYERYCDSCHGSKGAPVTDNPTLSDFTMVDLRVAPDYRYGTGQRAVFRTIAYGVESTPMVSYRATLSDAEMWDLSNYVISLQRG